MLDRRHLLAGLAAGSTVARASAAAVVLAPADADADLLALGRDLDEAVAAYLTDRPAYEEASEARMVAMEGSWARLDALRRPHAGPEFWAVWRELTGHHEPAIARGNALMETADALVTRIMDARPATLAGAAVQARAVAFTVDPTPNPVEADRDWDKLVVLRLAANLAALAD